MMDETQGSIHDLGAAKLFPEMVVAQQTSEDSHQIHIENAQQHASPPEENPRMTVCQTTSSLLTHDIFTLSGDVFWAIPINDCCRQVSREGRVDMELEPKSCHCHRKNMEKYGENGKIWENPQLILFPTIHRRWTPCANCQGTEGRLFPWHFHWDLSVVKTCWHKVHNQTLGKWWIAHI